MGGKSGKPAAFMSVVDLKSSKKVVIYGSDTCPYCVRVKKIFEDHQAEYDYRNIDQSKEYEKESEGLMTQLKYDTIPLVFVQGKFLGGCSDVRELEAKGELQRMLV